MAAYELSVEAQLAERPDRYTTLTGLGSGNDANSGGASLTLGFNIEPLGF